jgi:hypothetical protein
MKGERTLAKTELVPGMHIVDSDFHGISGGTRYSLQFWERIKDRIGPVKEAHMKFSEESWYRFFLITEDDVVIEFKGFSAGYSGEGPRGCSDVLKDIGFDYTIPFEKETFSIYREAK